jgi:hypothetical protein
MMQRGDSVLMDAEIGLGDRRLGIIDVSEKRPQAMSLGAEYPTQGILSRAKALAAHPVAGEFARASLN